MKTPNREKTIMNKAIRLAIPMVIITAEFTLLLLGNKVFILRINPKQMERIAELGAIWIHSSAKPERRVLPEAHPTIAITPNRAVMEKQIRGTVR